ncbi:hypothetical protein EV191_11220 [Tamaricihabitans halophyticus]|uniref:Uncharacterized protein n=1 Tax=Tamaricihabitans halophyticus TaxID=1262583 RepID=A0A4V2SSP6_9PSEU|nr:hypothetical protein [Tamaricihabitans halophyticus]TCP47226.1 hypothetical protein EV191_11220 [Tamaricihabitans halophyticus]
MRQSHAAVVERYTVLRGDFATEPHEAGWAGEARWFVHVLDASSPTARLNLHGQISPDGLNWCDIGEAQAVTGADSVVSWPVREFGQWLRVRGSTESPDDWVKVLIYLTLKS